MLANWTSHLANSYCAAMSTEDRHPHGAPERTRLPVGERRRLLAEAALRVMKREGVAAATTRAVCSEAGMPHGAFHYCFRTKKEFYAEVLSMDVISDLSEAWSQVAHASPSEAIVTLVRALWAQVEVDADAQRVLFDLESTVLSSPDLRDLLDQQYQASLDLAAASLARLQEEAGFRFASPVRPLAGLVLAALDGATWMWLTSRDPELARSTMDQLANVLITHIRTDQPDAGEGA
ncbi:transcriptional regulator BetI [Actinomyces slackii]|uniref:Transcriptional regulator BetI n=2 Tax=Actinomyces slackii TaxID=52774 RepID=A0A3S5EM28_9ACTO|nr:transcriptional regulator BetI [Actinomyces slackii]